MKTYPYYSLIGYKGLMSFPTGVVADPTFQSWFNILNPVVDENLIVSELKVEKADNTTGTLNFSIPPTNYSGAYIEINTIVELCGFNEAPDNVPDANNGGIPIWIGRIINFSIDIYGNVNCIAEGPASILRNIYISEDSSMGSVNPQMTVKEYIKNLVTGASLYSPYWEKNSTEEVAIPSCLRIDEVSYSGYINSESFGWYNVPIKDFDGFSVTELAGRWTLRYSGEPISVFDWIQRNIPNGFDDQNAAYYNFSVEITGYDSEKRSAGLPHTNKLSLFLDMPTWMGATQWLGGTAHIIYGENLISADLEYDWESIATTIAVYGQEIEQMDGSKRRITIQDYNPYKYQSPYLNADDDYISQYGLIPKTFTMDTISSPQLLYTFADQMRNLYINPIKSVSIDAINLTGYDTSEPLDVGRYLSIDFPGISIRHKVSEYYRCTKSENNLLNPTEDRYHVEYTKSSLTSEISSGIGGSSYSGSSSSSGGIGSGIRSISVNKENIPPVNGNVDIEVPVLKKTSKLDFQNINNGTFTETIDGGVVTQFQTTFDSLGRIVRVTDQDGHSTEIFW